MQPILRINLSNRTIDKYLIPRQWEVDFLGGASLGARLLYEELVPSLDPLSPEAPLLFMNGPLSGTSGPAVGRSVVCAKSPATGLWGESNVGGFLGAELGMAGFSGIWLTGKADKPVYLAIINDEVTFHPADHLWGLETYATQAAVKAELGDIKNVRVAVIGPAGEKQIPFALILADHGRVAGRTGMGAVMGSKNLKAIAVKGNGVIPVADPEKYAPLRSQANRDLKADSFTTVVHDLGTASIADYVDYLAEMPKRNFQDGIFDGACGISGSTVAETILTGMSACHACVIACGRVVKLEDGQKRKGPEYETLAGFGPNLLYSDASRITRIGELCDQLGMDTITLGNTIGLVYKLKEQGLISEADADGIPLEWGNPESTESLVRSTVNRQGLGAWIAQGSRNLAKHFGCEEEAVQVNGLEAAYHDPRGASGMALVYATSPRGACHNQSDFWLVDVGQGLPDIGIPHLDRHSGSEKSKYVALHQDYRTIFNSLVMCEFANVPASMIVDLINAACGLDWDILEMMHAGERAWNLKRVINNRLGLTSKNDTLPKAFRQPYSDHPEGADGFVPDFENMIQAYYDAREWDPETGYPKKEKLISLGLGWVVEDIW